MIYKNIQYTSIPNFPGYLIHTSGQVISTKEGRNCFKGQVKELHPVLNARGYCQYYMLDYTGAKKSPMQHQLLMRTFIPNPDKLPHINHMDGNKTNNTLDNLEWCTAAHNSQHAADTGLSNSTHCEVPIHMYSLSGKFLSTFKSIAEASRITTCPSASVVNCAKGKIKQSKGYLFSYKLLDALPAYTGPVITDSIKVTNLVTLEVVLLKTLKEVASYTGLHRSKFLRRFKKSFTFTIEYFYIEKLTK